MYQKSALYSNASFDVIASVAEFNFILFYDMIMQIPKGKNMSKKELSNREKAKKTLRPSRQTRSTVLFWTLLGGCIAVLAAALFFFFVFSRPSQPSLPQTEASQTTEQVQTESPIQTPIVTTGPIKTPKPLVMQDSFKELYEQNNDLVGWIKVENTDIDYPILQADDNSYYMDKDFYKEYSYPGSIFLDFRCDLNNMYQAAHQIVYGHNMKNETMFQQLTKYQDEDFFKENRYINIDTLYGSYVFEVFAAYEMSVSFNYLVTDFSDRDKWLEFIEVFQQKSDFETDIVLSRSDVVLTLSTCTNSHKDNMRFVVHARLTDPELYDMQYRYIY